MATKPKKPSRSPYDETLSFDLKHDGARQIFCAALAGIGAAQRVSPVEAVDYANRVVAEARRRDMIEPKD